MTPQQRERWVGLMGARTGWWELCAEAALEPDWEIVDPHFHFWIEHEVADPADPTRKLRTSRYLADEFLRDVQSGHRLTDFVYIECGSGYQTDGPDHLRPVGEINFALELAKSLGDGSDRPRLGAISAHADLAHAELDAILDLYVDTGGGLVRSIRHSAARLENPAARLLAGAARPGIYADPAFRRGVARLGERGLAFEAFQFHLQLHELVALVRETPGTTFIVNHLGTPIGYGRGQEADEAVFDEWARGIDALAGFNNIIMKLGGMASPVTEYDAASRPRPPSSEEFVRERGRYFLYAVHALGAERCMFESNFPVDSVSLSFTTLWNAYKIMAGYYSARERQSLLSETARRIYQLDAAQASYLPRPSFSAAGH
ncbi:amidohydrolase family protein [Martelella soudanensis]|uniref:amidohydrolase family protein n=1 Tax=unclassified Martelella TaxID=2629616 RepID=UPI0015DD86A0|nr:MULTISPECIES: amidohydrolase family protein [unclassified Martelella]